MEKIDKILSQSFTNKGIKKTLQSAHICFLAEEWGNHRFRAISFSKGILKVSVKSSPAASDLQMRESEIIEYVNTKIGKQLVKSVRIVLSAH